MRQDKSQEVQETDSTNPSLSEMPSESSEDKKPKRSKVKKDIEKKTESVEKKAERLIEQYKSKTSRKTGDLIGGDPEYAYYHVGSGGNSNDTIQKLLDLGYEREENPDVRFVGFTGGTYFKIPKTVHEFMKAERAKKRQAAEQSIARRR
jgi:hypothetical protein